ncbi:MAG: glucose 1-dehydrogenase [Clostridia bacterium]|nr:glucose 1-dehydrogenase [Clostridia bacterium]
MKTAIITGASGDIGIQIAQTLAKNGYNLAVLYNTNEDPIIALKKEFKNVQILDLKCDLCNEKQVEDTITTILKTFGQIDCLINCAGITQFKQIQDVTKDDYNKIFGTNVYGTVSTISKVAKHMISAQSGKIVNISSMWGVVGASVESLYSASKGAINTLTKALAKELGPSGITVNAICPGLIESKMNNHLDKNSVDDIVCATPVGRIGYPQDVANLVEFLISDKADFITGQIITIDGGLTL